MVTDRFHDEGVRLESFVTTVDVVCPSAGHRDDLLDAIAKLEAREQER